MEDQVEKRFITVALSAHWTNYKLVNLFIKDKILTHHTLQKNRADLFCLDCFIMTNDVVVTVHDPDIIIYDVNLL